MTSEVRLEPARSVSLYELEHNLCAFAAMADDVDDPELRAEVLAELGTTLRSAKDKRDRVVAFLRHCESQEELADREIERLKKRTVRISRVRAEIEAYVVGLIEQVVEPDRRGVRRLEGNHSTMRIQRNPDSVEITDIVALPGVLKDAVVTLPALVWDAILDAVGAGDRGMYEAFVKRVELKPDKRAIAAELKAGGEVRGASLKPGEFRLVLS